VGFRQVTYDNLILGRKDQSMLQSYLLIDTRCPIELEYRGTEVSGSAEGLVESATSVGFRKWRGGIRYGTDRDVTIASAIICTAVMQLRKPACWQQVQGKCCTMSSSADPRPQHSFTQLAELRDYKTARLQDSKMAESKELGRIAGSFAIAELPVKGMPALNVFTSQ
jgi:hypothetical protein